jgi:hypothetical protein
MGDILSATIPQRRGCCDALSLMTVNLTKEKLLNGRVQGQQRNRKKEEEIPKKPLSVLPSHH